MYTLWLVVKSPGALGFQLVAIVVLPMGLQHKYHVSTIRSSEVIVEEKIERM
jgi:hypothetical protein